MTRAIQFTLLSQNFTATVRWKHNDKWIQCQIHNRARSKTPLAPATEKHHFVFSDTISKHSRCTHSPSYQGQGLLQLWPHGPCKKNVRILQKLNIQQLTLLFSMIRKEKKKKYVRRWCIPEREGRCITTLRWPKERFGGRKQPQCKATRRVVTHKF